MYKDWEWSWHPLDLNQDREVWLKFPGTDLAQKRKAAIRYGLKFWMLNYGGFPFVVEFDQAKPPEIIMHGKMTERYELRQHLLTELERRSATMSAVRPVTEAEGGRFYVEAMMMSALDVYSMVEDYLLNTPNHGVRL